MPGSLQESAKEQSGEERSDPILIETSQLGSPLYMFAQRYVYDQETSGARKIGKLCLSPLGKPRLKVYWDN